MGVVLNSNPEQQYTGKQADNSGSVWASFSTAVSFCLTHLSSNCPSNGAETDVSQRIDHRVSQKRTELVNRFRRNFEECLTLAVWGPKSGKRAAMGTGSGQRKDPLPSHLNQPQHRNLSNPPTSLSVTHSRHGMELHRSEKHIRFRRSTSKGDDCTVMC
ncbi:hypothetical protein MHYP_G00353700 [Metynnis hypsauchen]